MEETYAFPIKYVREVLECVKMTKLPCRADYFKGLINVRGQGIPVLDLRARFKLPPMENENEASIIVADLKTDGKESIIGIMADDVHEVVEFEDSSLSPASKFGSKASDAFLKNIGKIGEKFVLIIDMELLFREDDILAAVQTADKSGCGE